MPATASGEPCAAALVLSRRAGPLPLQIAYVPKGPILDYDDLPLLGQVLGDLEDLARRKRAIFAKLDPDVTADGAGGKHTVELLCRRGWHLSREQIQFRNTMIIDLTPETAEIMARMKAHWPPK